MQFNLSIKKWFLTSALLFSFYLVNIFSQDYKSIKVDQLSDKQIQQIISKAESSGMTEDELANAAVLKGMPVSEVNKLKDRINKVKALGGGDLNTGGSKENVSRGRENIDLLSEKSSVKKARKKKRPVQSSKKKNEYGYDTKLEITPFKEQEKKNVSNNPLGFLFGEKADSSKIEEDDDDYLSKYFGFDLFSQENLTFEPSLNIATPVNYQLGAGDEILIDIWGASQQNYRLTVSPEGSVFIDNVGPVNVSGLTIDKAQARIINRLSTIYSGLKGPNSNTFAQVSIGNIRSIQVNLLGEVNAPGSYTLSSLATVFNALYVSGGPSENGSLRNIEVFRDGKLLVTLDVYEFLLNGDQKNNVRLQDQDIIKINPYQTRLELSGEFIRPLIYDAKQGETLDKMILYSGGFTDKAYTHRLRIERKTSRERAMADVAEDNFKNFQVQNGDKIFADSIIDRYSNRVEIKGAVYRPGRYELNDGLTLKQLIDKAEGLRGDAFMTRAIIYRLLHDYSYESIPIDLKALLNDQTEDVKLSKDDQIKVFSIFELKEEYFLQIEGEVIKPGFFPFVNNMSLENLIVEAGGFKESASLSRIEVARRVKNSDISTNSASIAEVYHFNVTKDLQLSDSATKFILEPFDRIFIRRSPGYEVQTTASIAGEAVYPGVYTIKNKDERISDLVNRSGGFTKDSYIKGARLVRKISESEKVRNRILAHIEKEADSTNVQYIGIDLARIMKNPGSKYDLILKDGDRLEIPKELQTVRLSGAFLYPITVRYDKSYGLRKYAAMAGGFADDAVRKKTYVVYANGSADRTRSFMGIKFYPKLEPGAEIVVPKKTENKKITAQEFLGVSSAVTSLVLVMITLLNTTK